MPAIEGAQRPFWMHQVVEYLIGLVLVGAAFQAPEPAVPAVMGAVVIAQRRDRPGSGVGVSDGRTHLHRWLDVVRDGRCSS